MPDTPMDVSYNAIVTDPTPANPSSHINPSVGMKKPQYSLNQSRPTGPGIHNKPGVSIWAGSAFGKSITAEVIAPSTYQGCDCATCKEMNVDCPDCPVCANPIPDEDGISEMKANAPLPENPIMPTNTYQKCECEICMEQNIPCSSCPECGGGLDAETQMAMYDSSIGKGIKMSNGIFDRLEKRDPSTKERQRMAEAGTAMPDGSFPIANATDLRNAIQSVGRAKDYSAAKKHIINRARALGMIDSLPEDWKNSAKKTDWADTVFDLKGIKK